MTENQFNFDLKNNSSRRSSGRISCPKAVKEVVWRKYSGNRMNGKCYVCKGPVTYNNFEVGHNKSYSQGGKWVVGNLRVLCRSCNRSMGTMTIELFKKKHFSIRKLKKSKKVSKKKIQRKTPEPFGWPMSKPHNFFKF